MTNLIYDARITPTTIEMRGIEAIIKQSFNNLNFNDVVFADDAYRIDVGSFRINVYMIKDRPNSLFMTVTNDIEEEQNYEIMTNAMVFMPIGLDSVFIDRNELELAYPMETL